MAEETVEQTTETTVEETTKENEETTTPETTVKPSTEEKTEEVKTDEVDFKAELEKAQNTINQQKGIIDHKEDVIKAEKAKREELDETAELEDDEDKFAELQKKNREEMDAFKYGVLEDKIEEEVSNLAKSEDEAELIRFHIKNSVKFGYTMPEIKAAVKSAWLISNEKKILQTSTELANSLRSKASVTTTANTSSQSLKTEPEEFSGDEKKLVDKFAKEGEKITASATR